MKAAHARDEWERGTVREGGSAVAKAVELEPEVRLRRYVPIYRSTAKPDETAHGSKLTLPRTANQLTSPDPAHAPAPHLQLESRPCYPKMSSSSSRFFFLTLSFFTTNSSAVDDNDGLTRFSSTTLRRFAAGADDEGGRAGLGRLGGFGEEARVGANIGVGLGLDWGEGAMDVGAERKGRKVEGAGWIGCGGGGDGWAEVASLTMGAGSESGSESESA